MQASTQLSSYTVALFLNHWQHAEGSAPNLAFPYLPSILAFMPPSKSHLGCSSVALHSAGTLGVRSLSVMAAGLPMDNDIPGHLF